MKFTRSVSVLALVSLALLAPAQSLLFDRGLPTANLNNAAGPNRSNVAWGFTGGSFSGDNFTLSGSAPAYNISTIRTWLVTGDDYDQQLPFNSLITSLTLWLSDGVSNNVVATSYGFTATRVTYPSSALTYQGTFGALRSLWQIDWNTSGLVLNGGTTYAFGVSGVTATGATTIFNHASNAALGGAPAAGFDDRFMAWNSSGSFTGFINSQGNGWDKSSDINVQVFGDPVPEPMTMSLAAGALVAALRRRKARKA